ncbi:MAG: hypothetical protein A2W38_05535 [Deltaproteobacteria bacterium RBG_19FT_COMBO_58_16]|nr:MAG: hypothetical protein A2W38_05535 [Deltaproteobacteria bacterium RBG_19FT_COMBO_58_16]
MAEDEILICPGCGGALGPVRAGANYGRVLLLDQCADCGGVWFDRWELYFALPASLLNLREMDGGSFQAANPAKKGTGDCPKCGRELTPFTDPTLPKDAEIERCARCNGLWLNRGGLEKYARHKASFAGQAPSASPASELKVLKNLQKELDTSRMTAPPDSAAFLADEPPVETGEVLKDMGFLILQSLVRLVFKF